MRFRAIVIITLMSVALFASIFTHHSTDAPSESPHRAGISWTPESGTCVWNATADGAASVAANWNPVGVPTTEDIVFNSTSVFNCTWDLAVTVGNFSLLTGFTGAIILAENLTVTTQLSINAGTLTGSAIHNITFEHEFLYNAGSISTDSLKLTANGSPAYMNTTLGANFRSFQASSNVIVKPIVVIVIRSITVDVGCTLTIDTGGIRNTPYFMWGYSNSGIIEGVNGGTLQIMNRASAPQSITFGVVNCGVLILGDTGTTGDVVLTTATNTTIGSSIQIWSLHATYVCTLDLDGYNLIANGITVTTRGRVNASSGTIINSGNWDSRNGELIAGTSNLIMVGITKTIETGNHSVGRFYDLEIRNATNAQSNIRVEHDLIIASGVSFTIETGANLNYNCSGGGTYTNTGFIMGPGNTTYSSDVSDRTLTFGKVKTDVTIEATINTTGDRTLTMASSTGFGNYLTLRSNHLSHSMILNTIGVNVSIHIDFYNETGGMVYYSYPWVVPSPNAYIIGIASGSYYLENTVTSTIELTESVTTGYADNATQWAINLCPTDGNITFLDGTYIFNCANDFYIGGWNYSAIVSSQQNITLSGSSGTILQFRDNLEVAVSNGVTIFSFVGDAENITIKNLNFTSSTGLVATYSSGVFLDSASTYAAFANLTIENCTFWELNRGIWGDGGAKWGRNNLITDCLFYGGDGLALHNQPSGILISSNTFIQQNAALMVDSVYNVTIHGNTFIDCGTGVGSYCIYIWDDVRTTEVTNNEFMGYSQAESRAIIIGNVAGKPDCDNITIAENTFHNFQYGVDARGGNHTYIRNNAFLETTIAIKDDATNSTVSGNINYSYAPSFSGSTTLAWDGIQFGGGARLEPTVPIRLTNISLNGYTGSTWVSWAVDVGDATPSATFSLTGLSPESRYDVFVDGAKFSSHASTTAGVITFSYDSWSTHDFVIQKASNPPAPLGASFEYIVDGDYVTFTDKSYGGAIVWIWNFGDGYGSTEQNPTHRYLKSGTYLVSLTVYDSEARSSKAQTNIVIEFDSDNPIDREDGGWSVYISEKLTLRISAMGVIFAGAILFLTGVYMDLPVITRKGRRVLGILMIIFGISYYLFFDNSWMG